MERSVGAGDRVRLLLRGVSGAHSVEGTVIVADSLKVRLAMDRSGRILNFPASAIGSVELLIGAGSKGVALPAGISEALDSARETTKHKGTVRDRLEAVDRGIEVLAKQLNRIDGLASAATNLRTGIQRLRDLAVESDLRERRLSRVSARDEVQASICGFDGVPTEVRATVNDLISHVLSTEEEDWQLRVRRLVAFPEVDTDEETIAILLPDQTLDVSLLLRLPGTPQLDEDVENIVVHVLDTAETVVGKSAELPRLQVGQSGTVTLRLRPPHLQDGGLFHFTVRLTFEGIDGALHQTAPQGVTVLVKRDSKFTELDNPYLSYASGATVHDRRMFFGRQKMIEQVSKRVRLGAGNGVAIYGQQRSGKTSLLHRVEEEIDSRQLVPVFLSAAIFKSENLSLAAAFAQEFDAVLQDVVMRRLGPLGQEVLSQKWPPSARMRAKKPVQYVRACVRAAEDALRTQGVDRPLFVVFVDEFQYVYRDLRNPQAAQRAKESVRDFMTQWKAILEAQLFAAVIAGQDTLPVMFRDFPNEFSTMATWRMSYLSRSETRALAQDPFGERGGSPFVGHSIDQVHYFTDGHPFFTQVLLSRVIERANDRRSSYVSDQDVRDAVDSLVRGDERIMDHVFECFYTADQTGLVDAQGESGGLFYDAAGFRARAVLSKVARAAHRSIEMTDLSMLQLDPDEQVLLEDLIQREVVVKKGSLVRIRVPLLAEHLRSG